MRASSLYTNFALGFMESGDLQNWMHIGTMNLGRT